MHERSINLTPLYSFSLLTSLQVKNEETLVSQTMRPPFLTLPPPTPHPSLQVKNEETLVSQTMRRISKQHVVMLTGRRGRREEGGRRGEGGRGRGEGRGGRGRWAMHCIRWV